MTNDITQVSNDESIEYSITYDEMEHTKDICKVTPESLLERHETLKQKMNELIERSKCNSKRKPGYNRDMESRNIGCRRFNYMMENDSIRRELKKRDILIPCIF